MEKPAYLRLFRLISVTNGWIAMITALGFQRHRILGEALGIGLAAGQYMFFTQQINLAAILWWTWAVLRGRRGAANDIGRILRGAVTLYILLTGAVYAAILYRVYAPGGSQAYVNITHHVITPLLFCIDWAVTEERDSYRWRWIAAWLLYPLAYLSWVFRLGARTRFYVYPFLDMGCLGPGRVAVNCTGMLLFMMALGAGMVFLNKKVGMKNGKNML